DRLTGEGPRFTDGQSPAATAPREGAGTARTAEGDPRRPPESKSTRVPRGRNPPGDAAPGGFALGSWSFPDVGHQAHEARPLDGVLDGALEGGAIAAALAAEDLALAGAELLERLHVLVVHERRPRAARRRAEPAAVLAAPA